MEKFLRLLRSALFGYILLLLEMESEIKQIKHMHAGKKSILILESHCCKNI